MKLKWDILKDAFYAFLLMLGAGILVVLLKYCYQFSTPLQLGLWALFLISAFASLHIWVGVGKRKGRDKKDILIVFAIGLTAILLALEAMMAWLFSSTFLAGLWVLLILYAYLYFYWAVVRVSKRKRRRKRKYEKWSREKVIKKLRERSRPGKVLNSTDVPPALSQAAIRHFGSWKRAKKEALGEGREEGR